MLKEAGAKAGKTFDISKFSDIIEAIHVIQDEMGITGTTAKEASSTISGSISSMKAAWGNLLPALIKGGDSFDQCVKNLIESIVGVEDKFGNRTGGVINNLRPALVSALSGIGTLIEELAPIIEAEFPTLVDQLLPPLIKAATALLKGLIKATPTIVKTIINELPDIVKEIGEGIAEAFGVEFPALETFGNAIKDNAKNIAKYIAYFVGAFAGVKVLAKIIPLITGLFGKSKGGGKNNFLANIGKQFANLGKIKTGKVALGLANISIIVGGMAILTAAVVAIMSYANKMTDTTTMFIMVGVIGALGFVGAKLAELAKVVGKIKVMTIVKGLANIAIIVAGMSALFLLIGAVSLLNFDYKKMFGLVAIIGALGAVGGALALFAGVVGAIPIPVVLMGLANMALVLGGVTALIAAFGALSKIDGFNEFIKSGGELLATVFNVIGKVAGSLIGGLGEGISNALPAIGENLAKFGENVKPLFDAIKGVDMTGVGAFFTSLVGLLAIATGNEIIEGIKSFFGGGESSLSKLGTQLADFATNAQEFFNIVSTLPENGFTNATKLFDCLAGVKSLPKEGGVVGWFTGNVNYDTLANGLKQLASEKVTGFFAAVTDLKQAGFDNATKLFDCLAGMKSLPKNGGVVGWFSGDVNYQNIAKGLKELSGEGVKNFFAMAAGLKPKAFENTKLLFDCLANINDLPSEGGWWQKLKGDKTTTLGKIAGEIEKFSDKSKAFFEQVNTLNLGNLNGLWESLNKSKDVTANVSKVVDEKISEIVKKIAELPERMGEGLRQGGRSLSEALVEVWTDAVKASVKPVNKVLEAANWILKEFGSDKRVIEWTPYAKGTGGHRGGNAMVNDGRGAELVQMPNGRTFIPNGRNIFLPNAPKGMKVLPAEQTARLMGRKNPTYHYANGIGDIDLWSYIDNASGLTGKIADSVSYDGMSGYAASVGKGMVSTFTGAMTGWVEKLFDEAGAKSIADYVASAGVEQWRSTVIRALKMEGEYSAANVERTLFQMQTESGGNPKAINLWDSNAQKGIPSKGLMQVIDPTFRTYARSGFDKNIYDPLSNILASVRYAKSRYGSLGKAYRGVGYSNGVGELSLPTRSNSVRMTYTPESDASIYNSTYAEYNTYSPSFVLNIEGTTDDRAMARKIKRFVREAFDEMIDSMDSKTTRLQEV